MMAYAASYPVETQRQYRLPTGNLLLTLHHESEPFDEICGIAARPNPKRGFLFVSKLLGRYTPIRPSVLRMVQYRLAQTIPHDIPGPILIVGMAEAAVGLGQGIHDEFAAVTGRDDVLFSHTTRYVVQGHRAMSFQEEHSHAPQHFFYWPNREPDVSLLEQARTLIVVDDECTTKKTFYNCIKTLSPHLPHLTQARLLVIHDWAADISGYRQGNLTVDFHSLTRGHWHFDPCSSSKLRIPPAPDAIGNGLDKTRLLKMNLGRIATSRMPGSPPKRLPNLKPATGDRVLILGTGEFQYLPFRLAEKLESNGIDVHFQSTTRSPLLLGGEIQAAIEFDDSYGEGIPYYLYNSKLEEFDRVYFCCETDHLMPPDKLANLSNLTPIFF